MNIVTVSAPAIGAMLDHWRHTDLVMQGRTGVGSRSPGDRALYRLIIALSVAVTLTAMPRAAVAGTWPKLSSGKIEQCSDALEVGKAAFNSEKFFLFAPPDLPADFKSHLVLAAEALDISGGDALQVDAQVFEKLPIGGEGPPRSIYWQKIPSFAYRLVVSERPNGWRGDFYSLFAIDEKTRPDDFLSAIRADSRAPEFTAVISGERPPLIFQELNSKRIWIADLGETSQSLADWRIHAVQAGRITATCTVRFRPAIGKPIALLPESVRRLERLMDQTIGSGANEGSLQSTVRIRLHVQDVWANAALRPWALENWYNTREEVDAGLRRWAASGGRNRRLYQDIERQYPIAEQALAGYYRMNFKKSAAEAKVLAAYTLDVAIRSHYTFHSERSENIYSTQHSKTNP